MMILVAFASLTAVLLGIGVLHRPVTGLYLGVALSGVLMAPDLPVVGTRLAIPDVPLFLTLVGLSISFSVSRGMQFPKARSIKLVLSLFAGFLFLSVISLCINGILRNIDILNSVVEVLSYIYGFLVAGAVILLLDDWNKWNRFVLFWLVGVAAVSAISVLAILGLAPDWAHHGGGRIKSTLRAVNQLPPYVAPAIPMLIGSYMVSQKNTMGAIWIIPLLFSVVVALSVTGSRIALGMSAFVVVLSIGFCTRYIRRYPLTAMSIFLISVSGALVFLYYVFAIIAMGPEVLPDTMRALVRPIERTVTAASIDDYLGARGQQLEIIMNNWYQGLALGVGPANFMEVFDHRHSVHSTYLAVYIELGLASLVLLLGGMGLLVVRGYQAGKLLNDSRKSIMLGMAVIAFLALGLYGLVNFGLRQRIFWLILGLVLAGVNIAWKERHVSSQADRLPPRLA